MGDATHFGFGVGHHVPPFARTISRFAHALVAEIHIAVQLAHDQQVDCARHIRFERGQPLQPRHRARGAQIGEQPQLRAQAQHRLFGPQRAFQRIAGRVTYRAEQHRIGARRHVERFFG